jgi:hypothetical protein
MGYAKLFSTITESSLWSEPKEVRLLFVTMLAKANSVGFVEASIPGLARVANLTDAEVQSAIPVLEGPDPFSKNPECEGRRIISAPGGWIVLNYEDYRSRASEEERREYMREYMRNYRKESTRKQPVNKVNQSKESPSASVSKSASSCTQKDVEDFCESLALPRSDGEAMFLHWQDKGSAKIKDWKLTIRKWKAFGYLPSQKASGKSSFGAKPRTEQQSKLDREFEEAQKLYGSKRSG